MFFMSEEDQHSSHDRERHAKDSLAVNAGLEAFFFFRGGGVTQAFCILKEARAHLTPPPLSIRISLVASTIVSL